MTAFQDVLADNRNAYPRGGVVAPLLARTTAQSFGDLVPTGATQLEVYVNVTVYTAGSLTVTIQGVTPDGVAYTLLASTALAATGLVRLRVSPYLTAAANAVAADILPDKVRIDVAVGGAQSITYSISAVLAP